MALLTIAKEKCLRCGLCVKACPSCILQMTAEGPECINEHGCILCSHCAAVCPVGAIEHRLLPLQELQPAPEPPFTPEQALAFLQSRRSVRIYRPQPPSEEVVRKLLEACRYAPTAGNSQGLSYIVLRDREEIKAVCDLVADYMEEEVAQDGPRKRYFTSVLEAYRGRGQDVIGRQAPCLIIAVAKRLNLAGESNAEQCFAYAMLYGPSLGLGTCYGGFISLALLSGYQPLLERLRLSPKQRGVGALLVGYSACKYRRLPLRQPVKAEFR